MGGFGVRTASARSGALFLFNSSSKEGPLSPEGHDPVWNQAHMPRLRQLGAGSTKHTLSHMAILILGSPKKTVG